MTAAIVAATALTGPAASSAQPAATPTISATVVQADGAGLLVHVTGTGFSGAEPGLIIGIAPSSEVGATAPGDYVGAVTLTPSQIKDGSFATDLALITSEDIDSMNHTVDYEVHAQSAGTTATADTAREQIFIDFDTWPDMEGPYFDIADVDTTHGTGTKVTATLPGARGRVAMTLAGATKEGWMKDGAVSFLVPRDLPPGTYTARWEPTSSWYPPGGAEMTPGAMSRVTVHPAPADEPRSRCHG